MNGKRLALLVGAAVALGAPPAASAQQLSSESNINGCFLLSSGAACMPGSNSMFMTAGQQAAPSDEVLFESANAPASSEARAESEESESGSPFSFMTSGMRPYLGI